MYLTGLLRHFTITCPAYSLSCVNSTVSCSLLPIFSKLIPGPLFLGSMPRLPLCLDLQVQWAGAKGKGV